MGEGEFPAFYSSDLRGPWFSIYPELQNSAKRSDLLKTYALNEAALAELNFPDFR